MWTYSQSTGFLLDKDSTRVGVGYAGRGEGKNNPSMQAVKNTGPIPCGLYIIGPPEDHLKLGPFALPLTPDPTNEMYDRGDFFMHGDSIKDPGTASHGCIIMPRNVRLKVHSSGDELLQVIP